MALIARSFLFLTQFISSHSLLLLPTISWILLSKNCYLLFLTIFLKFFQSSNYLEVLPIFQLPWRSVPLQIFLTFFVLPWFQMFCDIDYFWVFETDFIYIVCEFLYNVFKVFLAFNMVYVKSFDGLNNFSNKHCFFFTIFDNSFSGLDVFLKNQNIHCKRNMIWWYSPFRMNDVIIKFLCIWMKKHKMDSWVQIIKVIQISSKNLII